MKIIYGLISILLISACQKSKTTAMKSIDGMSEQKFVVEQQDLINENGLSIKDRFLAPDNYELILEETGSFGAYIQNFRLKPYGAPILQYDGTPISNQFLHEAVLDIDTGTKDLQQCADAIIRLRAEYLYLNKKFDDIKFHFTSGDLMTWNAYKKGTRAFVNGNNVSFRVTANADDSYENFRNYLDLIFTYAGTISLNKETEPVLKTSDLKTGDILITGGSPGHVVFIAGVAKNKEGEKIFLLGEGFTPAQSIHILKNPDNEDISPWYNLKVENLKTETARYTFSPTNFRSF